MPFETVIALATAMFILAAIPGPSVLTIVARSLSCGFSSTIPLIAGVVLGDIIYLVLSFMGLSIVINLLGDLFIIIKICGSVYLFYLGSSLLLEKEKATKYNEIITKSELSKNFFLGLSLALSNPKVILFYISFFPTIIDMSNISVSNLIYILLVVESVLLSVLLIYSYCSSLTRGLLTSKKSVQYLNICSGSVLVGSGVVILTKH